RGRAGMGPPGSHVGRVLSPERLPGPESGGVYPILAFPASHLLAPRRVGRGGRGPATASWRGAAAAVVGEGGTGRGSAVRLARVSLAASGRGLQCGDGTGDGALRCLRHLLPPERPSTRGSLAPSGR